MFLIFAQLLNYFLIYLKKAGLIKYNNINKLDNGLWQADTHLMGLLKKQNCYFPSHWDEVQVMKAIIESLKNPTRVKYNHALGKLEIDGIFNGIKIRTVLSASKEIHTTYPIRIIT